MKDCISLREEAVLIIDNIKRDNWSESLHNIIRNSTTLPFSTLKSKQGYDDRSVHIKQYLSNGLKMEKILRQVWRTQHWFYEVFCSWLKKKMERIYSDMILSVSIWPLYLLIGSRSRHLPPWLESPTNFQAYQILSTDLKN